MHPMAGTEFSGPLAAIGRLFDYKTAIICDPELSDADALESRGENAGDSQYEEVIYEFQRS